MTQSVLSEWHGTADAPLPTDIESAPVPAGEELLHYGYNVGTRPAAEAALLTRIAEVAGELRNPEPETKMTLVRLDRLYELTKLTNEWRIEWKHKPRT